MFVSSVEKSFRVRHWGKKGLNSSESIDRGILDVSLKNSAKFQVTR